MYRCNECNGLFNEPDIQQELHSEVDSFCYEEVPVCIFCGSEEIEKLHQCDCGEWITVEEDYCENCIDARDEAFKGAIQHLEMCGYDYEHARNLLATIWEE